MSQSPPLICVGFLSHRQKSAKNSARKSLTRRIMGKMICSDVWREMPWAPHFQSVAPANGGGGRAERFKYAATRQSRINDDRVIEAINKVPRHRFVPLEHNLRYLNRRFPSFRQNLFATVIVALMTDLLELSRTIRFWKSVQVSAIKRRCSAELAKKVYTIEIIDELGEKQNNDSAN